MLDRGPHQMSTFYGRYRGFEQALQDYGLDAKLVPTFLTNTNKMDIERAFAELLQLEKDQQLFVLLRMPLPLKY